MHDGLGRINVTLSHRRRRRRTGARRLRLRRIGLGPDLQPPRRVRRQPQRQRQSVSDLWRDAAAVAALLPGPVLQRTHLRRAAGLQRRQLQRFGRGQHQLRLRRVAHGRVDRRAVRHVEPAVALHRRGRTVQRDRSGQRAGRRKRHLPGPARRWRFGQPRRGDHTRRHGRRRQREHPGQQRGGRRGGGPSWSRTCPSSA